MDPIVTAAQQIAKRLNLNARPLFCLDFETTGKDPLTARVVQIGFVRVLSAGGEIVRRERLINPGIPIPADATAVHGITDVMVQGAPTFDKIAEKLHGYLCESVIVGFNVRRYDLPLAAAELGRAGITWDPETAEVIDALTIFHKRHPRDLQAAARIYTGTEHVNAHGALADSEMTLAVLAGQLAAHEDLPGTTRDLAEYCADRRPEWLDLAGKVAWMDGAPCLTFGKWAGVPLDKVDPGYLRWMLNGGFGEATKRVIRGALRGELPTKPAGL